jgi:hypothetical protein
MIGNNFNRKWILLAVGAAIVLMCFGCTHNITVSPRLPEKVYTEKIPLDAGLYISGEFATYRVAENRLGDTWYYTNLGEKSAIVFQLGLSQIFRSLNKVDKHPPYEKQKTEDIQIVVEPAIDKFDFDIPFTKMQVYPASIHYHITIFDMEGGTIFSKTVEGVGDIRGRISYDYSANPSNAASRAVEDGVDKALEAILASEELKQFIKEQKGK